LSKLKCSFLDFDELATENFEKFLLAQNHLKKFIVGNTIHLTKDFAPILLHLWNLETLVIVNDRVMDLLANLQEDQLKNHRIKTLKIRILRDENLETIARYCRLVPAITSLNFPYSALALQGIELVINGLKDLKELNVYTHFTRSREAIRGADLRRLKIENLEKVSFVQLKGSVSCSLSTDDFEAFVENHPKVKEMEVQIDRVDLDLIRLIVSNLKLLEKLFIKTKHTTLCCNFKDLKIMRKASKIGSCLLAFD
jgi:hypothetical protein